MIDLMTVIRIAGFLITVAGLVGAYFTMQTKQNMKLEQHEMKLREVKEGLEKEIDRVREQHEKEVEEVRRKQSITTTNQIKTEKTLEVLVTKMDRLLKDMDDLKNTGCGRCTDGTL